MVPEDKEKKASNEDTQRKPKKSTIKRHSIIKNKIK